eukprot:scaffold159272_cov36-Tisochrysis_lutea.AAC.2
MSNGHSWTMRASSGGMVAPRANSDCGTNSTASSSAVSRSQQPRPALIRKEARSTTRDVRGCQMGKSYIPSGVSRNGSRGAETTIHQRRGVYGVTNIAVAFKAR